MLAMHPIDEPDVVFLLNGGRFDGDVDGYIMMDGPTYLGHALFLVTNGVTTVLDTAIEDTALLDGIVRACIANGENRGAGAFSVNQSCPALAKWWSVFCGSLQPPVPTSHIFGQC